MVNIRLKAVNYGIPTTHSIKVTPTFSLLIYIDYYYNKRFIMKCLFPVFVLISLIIQTSCIPHCPGKNEVYDRCHSFCPADCAELKSEKNYCAATCYEGCGCINGYIKNSKDECIPISEC